MSISQNELEVLDVWLNAEGNAIPNNIRSTIDILSKLPSYLSEASGNKEAMLRLMKTLMKIIPSSEKGTLPPKA